MLQLLLTHLKEQLADAEELEAEEDIKPLTEKDTENDKLGHKSITEP